jgi:hypothetical protein
MEYAAMTFWLVVIVFTALGVHRLWSGLIQPRIVNSILLPGTLIAQLGHVLGLLVTGGTVNNTTLIKDDDSGEPQTGKDVKPRIPVVGPILIAMLPMLACAAAIYVVSQYLGQDILGRMERENVPRQLPTVLSAVWPMLHESITLVERLVDATRASNLDNWQTWAFVYLVICLTVRMAPLPGTLRGAIGAILVLGVVAALAGTAWPAREGSPGLLDRGWPLLTFSVAVLLFLLLVSLSVRGTVGLVKILFGQEKGG